MKTVIFLSLICMLGLGACKDESENAGRSEPEATGDPNFVKEASYGHVAEIEGGKLAPDHSANEDVKQFSSMMVTSHQQAYDELKAIAMSKNILIPINQDSVRNQFHQLLVGRSPEEFDDLYMQLQVTAHQQAIQLYEHEANFGDDAELRAYAAKYLPVIREHYSQAQSVRAKVNRQ